jgi:hypothetical protein
MARVAVVVSGERKPFKEAIEFLERTLPPKARKNFLTALLYAGLKKIRGKEAELALITTRRDKGRYEALSAFLSQNFGIEFSPEEIAEVFGSAAQKRERPSKEAESDLNGTEVVETAETAETAENPSKAAEASETAEERPIEQERAETTTSVSNAQKTGEEAEDGDKIAVEEAGEVNGVEISWDG